MSKIPQQKRWYFLLRLRIPSSSRHVLLLGFKLANGETLEATCRSLHLKRKPAFTDWTHSISLIGGLNSLQKIGNVKALMLWLPGLTVLCIVKLVWNVKASQPDFGWWVFCYRLMLLPWALYLNKAFERVFLPTPQQSQPSHSLNV